MVFQGEFDHGLDDKWRVIIPNRFRASLGETFFMTKGLDGCIFVYTKGAYEELSGTFAKQRQLDEHTMRLQRFFTATEVSTDTQGRVAIPAKLREYAKIEEQSSVVIVGTGSRIEIWSSKRWANYNDDLTAEKISESARELGIA